MKKSQVLAILSNSPLDYASYGVKSLFLFSSVARDQASEESDVDILVEFEEIPTFDKYMDFKFHLEDLLSKKVDLVERQLLHPSLRSSVASEAVQIA